MINGFMRETAKTTRGYHNWHWEAAHNIALRIWEHVVGGMINFVFTDG